MFDDVFAHLVHPSEPDLSTEIPNSDTSFIDAEEHDQCMDNAQLSNHCSPLQETSLSFWNTSELDDELNRCGTSVEDAACWQPQDGQASCAVVAQISVYESITGIDLSEAEACQIAQENGWFDPETGTLPADVGKLLNHFGIPTYQSYDATLDDIALALEQGDKVIVALDAYEIWYPTIDPVTGLPIEQPDAGHAVWVTGIEQQPDGSVKIILNDSGTPDGQMKEIDAVDFLNAWQDYGNFLVVADAPEASTWA